MAANTSRGYRERLIDEVKKYPVLYDNTHENHRDIDVRDRCWAEISDKLGENSEVLKREWKSLRDSFRQAVKKSKRGATTKAGFPVKRWRLENRMAFLIPFMTVRRNFRELGRTAKATQKEEVDTIKCNEPAQTEADGEAESTLEPETEVWDASSTDCDSLDLFFASICQSTKRLPKKYQNVLKLQFLDVLVKVEEDYETELSQSKDDF